MPDEKKPESDESTPDELPPEDDWEVPSDSPASAAPEAPAEQASGSQQAEEAAAKADEAPREEDKFRPEAIAARVDAIGEETDLDRVAREEERKLLDRKRQKKKGKRGLESAASKRLAKIGEGHVKRPSAAADAVSPEADTLLESVDRAKSWIAKHREVFGGLVVVALLGTGGFFGWMYWQDKRTDDASAALAQAFADERGHISEKADDDDDDSRAKQQLYPTFASAADRREAALAKYRRVESKYSGTGAAILARLAEAALLLDSGDAKGAVLAYDDVGASPLAMADSEVRGRAVEGRGFAQELLAQSDSANAGKHLDDALASYKDLQAVDMTGMKELGMYHEARVLVAKGDKAKATVLLKDVYKLVSEPGDKHRFSYLEFVVEDRLRDLDPKALPPKAPKAGPGSAGGAGGAGAGGAGGAGSASVDTDNPQIQELIRQMNEKARQKGGAPQ